jgi:hypothetical protein
MFFRHEPAAGFDLAFFDLIPRAKAILKLVEVGGLRLESDETSPSITPGQMLLVKNPWVVLWEQSLEQRCLESNPIPSQRTSFNEGC